MRQIRRRGGGGAVRSQRIYILCSETQLWRVLFIPIVVCAICVVLYTFNEKNVYRCEGTKFHLTTSPFKESVFAGATVLVS